MGIFDRKPKDADYGQNPIEKVEIIETKDNGQKPVIPEDEIKEKNQPEEKKDGIPVVDTKAIESLISEISSSNENIFGVLAVLSQRFDEKIRGDEIQKALMTDQKNRILKLEEGESVKAQKHLVAGIMDLYDYILSAIDKNKNESSSKSYETLDDLKNMCEVLLENNCYQIYAPTGKYDATNMSCVKVVETDRPDYDQIIYRVQKSGLIYEENGRRNVVRVPRVEVFKLKR